MSAANTGTPAADSCSASSCRVFVLPVPVAPATSPCRFTIAIGMRIGTSGSASPFTRAPISRAAASKEYPALIVATAASESGPGAFIAVSLTTAEVWPMKVVRCHDDRHKWTNERGDGSRQPARFVGHERSLPDSPRRPTPHPHRTGGDDGSRALDDRPAHRRPHAPRARRRDRRRGVDRRPTLGAVHARRERTRRSRHRRRRVARAGRGQRPHGAHPRRVG